MVTPAFEELLRRGTPRSRAAAAFLAALVLSSPALAEIPMFCPPAMNTPYLTPAHTLEANKWTEFRRIAPRYQWWHDPRWCVRVVGDTMGPREPPHRICRQGLEMDIRERIWFLAIQPTLLCTWGLEYVRTWERIPGR